MGDIEDEEEEKTMTLTTPQIPDIPPTPELTTPDGFSRDVHGVYVSVNVDQQNAQLSVISEAEQKHDDEGSDDEMYVDVQLKRRETNDTSQGTPYQTPNGSPKLQSALSVNLVEIDELDVLDDDAMYIDMQMGNIETARAPAQLQCVPSSSGHYMTNIESKY